MWLSILYSLYILAVVCAVILLCIGLCLGTRTVVDMEDVDGVAVRVGAETRAGKGINVVGKVTGVGEEAIVGSITGSITGMTESETETGAQAKEATRTQVRQTPIEDTSLIPGDRITTTTDLFNLESFFSVFILSCLVSSSLALLLVKGSWSVEWESTQTDRRREYVFPIVLEHSLYFGI